MRPALIRAANPSLRSRPISSVQETGDRSATDLQCLDFLYPVFTYGRNIQSLSKPHHKPTVDNLSQIMAAFLQCLTCSPYAFKLRDFAVVWFVVLDEFILRPSQSAFDVFCDQMSPRLLAYPNVASLALGHHSLKHCLPGTRGPFTGSQTVSRATPALWAPEPSPLDQAVEMH